MTPEQISGLPPWLQITLSVVAFVGAAWIYMAGLFKSLPQPVPRAVADNIGKPAADGVVVPSLTFADNKIIGEWIEEIKRGNRHDERQTEILTKLIFTLEGLDRRLEDMYHQLKRLEQSPRRGRPERR